MEGWQTYKLDDIAKIKHGYAFKGEFFSEKPNKNILLTPGNFNIGGGFKSDKFKYYTGEIPRDYILCAGDVIVTMTDLSKNGDTLGYSALVPKIEGVNFLHNQRTGLLQLKFSSEVDINYLYWILRTKNYQRYVVDSASGTTVKHTSPNRILDYSWLFPPLPLQHRIAEILDALDDKIELNRQMNHTLEAMTQALYKHHFVDDIDPENLPEGWRLGNVLEMADLLSGGTPKTERKEYWNGGINWISAKDITENNNGFITETEKKISEQGLNNSAAKLLPKFTTVVSARGTVGKYCILSEEMAISQSNYGLKSKLQNSDFFIFLLVENMIQMMRQYAYGTVFDTITTKTFQEIEIVLPQSEFVLSFEEIIKPAFQQRLSLTKENKSLMTIRDTLLPKLISGEIIPADLKNIENQI
ncbi:MAG: restriction endonuclease subunit S [bacterium]